MKLKNVLLTGAFLMFAAGTFVNAQENPQPRQEMSIQEKMTPLKPADGRPFIFYSQTDMDAARVKKTDAIKIEIRQNHQNPERVKALREDLWRLENAILQELPKQN